MSKQREQFQTRLEALVEQVREWVEPHEWVTKAYPKKMRDAGNGVYQVPNPSFSAFRDVFPPYQRLAWERIPSTKLRDPGS